MSEEKKQKLKEYQRKYREAKNNRSIVMDNRDSLLSTTTNNIVCIIF